MARPWGWLLGVAWAAAFLAEPRAGAPPHTAPCGCAPPRLSLRGGFSSDEELGGGGGAARGGRVGGRGRSRPLTGRDRPRVDRGGQKGGKKEGREWDKEVGGLIGEERRRKRAKYHPNILFVGQLPYNVTADQVEGLFLRRGISSVKVRLLTDKKTKASRGIGFVEFETEDDCAKALAMDHSLLGGRRIRIEKTAAGGGNKDKRKARVKRAKTEQEIKRHGEVMNMLREVFIKDREKTLTEAEVDNLSRDTGLHPSRRPQGPSARDGGAGAIRLDLADIDEDVISFLKTLPQEVARRAARAAARADVRGVENRGAWVMGMIKRRLRRAERIAKRLKGKSVQDLTPADGRRLETGMSESEAEEGLSDISSDSD